MSAGSNGADGATAISSAHRPVSTDALSRASTEELLLELRRRIITPREAREVCEDWGGLNPRGNWSEEAERPCWIHQS